MPSHFSVYRNCKQDALEGVANRKSDGSHGTLLSAVGLFRKVPTAQKTCRGYHWPAKLAPGYSTRCNFVHPYLKPSEGNSRL